MIKLKTVEKFIETTSLNTLNHYKFPTKIYFLLVVLMRVFLCTGFSIIYEYTGDESLKRVCGYPIIYKITTLAVMNSIKCGLIGYFLLGFRANATFIIPLFLSLLHVPTVFIYAFFEGRKLQYISTSCIVFTIVARMIYKIGNSNLDLSDYVFIFLMLVFHLNLIYLITGAIDNYKRGLMIKNAHRCYFNFNVGSNNSPNTIFCSCNWSFA